MANGSSQKFIGRNRPRRVQIEYDVETYGAERKIELPFVMGVMADLSGASEGDLPSVDERKFLEIDIDNFDARLKAMKPKVQFTVPDKLSGEEGKNLPVEITFESMDDFSPAAVAQKIEPLRKLLEARKELEDLWTYIKGQDAEDFINQRVLAKAKELAQAADSVPTAGGSETSSEKE
jgi:type VI secretion system protein ImpB